MNESLVSINLVAYNAEKTLTRTLESIAGQLEAVFEVIMVNDGSTDSTLSIMESFKQKHPVISCTIISNKTNLGITRSRNVALTCSQGAFVAVLDSDDEWTHPLKLKKQLEFLQNHPSHAAVGTQMNIVDGCDTVIKTTTYKTADSAIRRTMLISNQIGHSSSMIRNKGLRYDESLYIWEDFDLFLSLGAHAQLANLDEVMVTYLRVPKKYRLSKRIRLVSTELNIIWRYKNLYPNFYLALAKICAKYIVAVFPR